jgi:hypothetical protein
VAGSPAMGITVGAVAEAQAPDVARLWECGSNSLCCRCVIRNGRGLLTSSHDARYHAMSLRHMHLRLARPPRHSFFKCARQAQQEVFAAKPRGELHADRKPGRTHSKR